MPETIDPRDVPGLSRAGLPYLTAAERHELADLRIRLFVIAAQAVAPPRVTAVGDDFGSQTTFDVIAPGLWDAQPRRLALKHTGQRAEQARAISRRLEGAPAGARVGPFVLTRVETRSGHTAWSLNFDYGTQLPLAEASEGSER